MEATVTANLIESVRAANILNARFQKFPMLKLTLRLLTEICDAEVSTEQTAPRHKSPKLPEKLQLPSGATDPLRGQYTQTSTNVDDGSKVYDPEAYKNDALHYIHQHLRTLICPLTADKVLNSSAVVKIKPPNINQALDRLITTIAVVAKLFVAEIVTNSLAAAVAQEETFDQIEPRHVYEALRNVVHKEYT